MRAKQLIRLARYAALPGLLLANGCLTVAERGADLVLSPGAVENALKLPYTAFAGVAEFLIRVLPG